MRHEIPRHSVVWAIKQDFHDPPDSFIFVDYFLTNLLGDVGASGVANVDVETSGTRTFFTDSGKSVACATNWLTCQSWVSVSFVLNAGIPDSRIPFAAFQ